MPEHEYDCTLRWTGEKKGRLEVAGLPAIEVATPPEFDGHPGIWTPEHLFVAAASTCLMTTFVALAARARLVLGGYRAEARGLLAQDAAGKLAITRIELAPEITVRDPADEARARDLCRKAEKYCLISNSMTTVIEVKPRVTVKEVAAATDVP
jgi:peroxiredoxin-like protein